MGSLWPLALVAVLLAGCATPAQTASPAGVELRLVAKTCPASRSVGCFEPVVAAFPGGRLFGVVSHCDALLASGDDGMSWVPLPLPPLPVAARPGSVLGDCTVLAGPGGALWFVALVEDQNALTGRSQNLAGIVVARSDDGGHTWPADRYVGLGSGQPLVATDRPWLVFADKSHMTLVWWSSAARQEFLATTSDGGGTWSEPSEAAGLHPGEPAVLPSGGIGIPSYEIDGSAARVVMELREASTGAFTSRTIATEASVPDAPWPAALRLADGSLGVAWIDGQGAVKVATSRDGASWSPPRTVSDGHPALPVAPALVESRDGLVVTWYAEDPAGQTLMVASPGGSARAIAHVSGRAPVSDFVSALVDPRGRVLLAYADPASGFMMAWV